MKPATAILPPGQIPHLPPDSICGYTILRALGQRTFLAIADGGRHVVLKPLDADCLLQGQLHPSIKERLARVRELALKGVANLHGIERDTHGVFLVWEFVNGQPMDEHIRSASTEQLPTLMRELVLAVEALHALGIIHGALHMRNVIIDTTGRPRLTHISPLLFHDSAVDAAAVMSILRETIERRGETNTPLGQRILSKEKSQIPLRELTTRILTVPGNQNDLAPLQIVGEDRRRRLRTLLWALAITAVGAGVALSVHAIAKNMLPVSSDSTTIETRSP